MLSVSERIIKRLSELNADELTSISSRPARFRRLSGARESNVK